MNFKYKCLLQRLFSKLPKGELLNYLFQKYVTKSLPGSNEYFLHKVQQANNHYEKFKSHNTLDVSDNRYYEFGAGWDLITPISMGLLGFEVTCIDIRKLVMDQLIFDTIKKFIENKDCIPFPVKQLNINQTRYQLDYLKNQYNLVYIAPLDARNTGFISEYFDFASSTVTFEHIPECDLVLILNEIFRILKSGGILSLMIDYRDHWSYFDKNISIYNFLRYSDKDWSKYNPSMHYQNRLRHKDYIKIISKTDFTIMEEILEYPSEEEITALVNLQINEKYKKYSIDELGVKGSHIILKK